MYFRLFVHLIVLSKDEAITYKWKEYNLIIKHPQTDSKDFMQRKQENYLNFNQETRNNQRENQKDPESTSQLQLYHEISNDMSLHKTQLMKKKHVKESLKLAPESLFHEILTEFSLVR